MISNPEPGVPITPEIAAGLVSLAADAARAGDIATLERALDAGVDVSATTPRGDSLLMLAAYHGRADAVMLLLARGADANQPDSKGQSPLPGLRSRGSSTSPGCSSRPAGTSTPRRRMAGRH